MIRALWIVTWLFVGVGILASALRLAYPHDAISRFAPAHEYVVAWVGATDPFAAIRPAEVRRMDSPFSQNPGLTRMHVIPGAVFLAMAPFQFMPFMRRRFLTIHRWSGRLLMLLATAMVASGMYFGIATPFGGAPEAVAIALFGSFFAVSLVSAWIQIRRGRQDLHREWMIRAFASAIAISTVRVIGAPLDLPLTLAGFPPAQEFAILVWLAWVSTIVVAELWIRRTRVTA